VGVAAKRHRVVLQTRAAALDGYGDDIVTYTTLATPWGSLEAIGGAEQLERQQVRAEASHRIVIRYAPAYAGISPADRAMVGTRTFDIISVLDLTGRQQELELIVKERL